VPTAKLFFWAMNKNAALSVLVAVFVCGCTHESEPYHLEVNGQRALFCVPDEHRVHLPFGFPETDPKRDEGFAFSGCPSAGESESCAFPHSVSGGAVGPLTDAVHWQWKSFSRKSEYRVALEKLSAPNINDVRIFDRGRMLRVVTKSNLANVFFWASAGDRQFTDPPALHAQDRLVAVCHRPGFNFKDPKRPVDAIQCERYTASPQYSLSYNFSMDQISLRKVHDLDRRVIRAIDSWRCKAKP
jgi:hypothetical protein